MKRILALSLVGLSTNALAGVNVQNYQSTANATYQYTEDAILESSPRSGARQRRIFFSAQYHFVNDPLVEYVDEGRGNEAIAVVDSIQTLEFGAGMFVTPDLAVIAAVPLSQVHLAGAPHSRFSAGDSRLFAKIQLLSEKKAIVATSLIPEIRIPTGTRSLHLSNSSWGAGLGLAWERDFGPVRLAYNFGYRFTPGARYFDIDYRHQLPMALGAYLPLTASWGLNAEAAGALSLPVSQYNNPGEAYLGVRHFVIPEASLSAGAAVGSLSPYHGGGASDFRVLVGLKLSPES